MAVEFENKFHVSPQDPEADKKHPIGEYEYVDVTFIAADTDQVVNYSIINPENPLDVRFLDINQGDARVYRSRAYDSKQWNYGYVVLRCDTAGYTTRLMLFVERN